MSILPTPPPTLQDFANFLASISLPSDCKGKNLCDRNKSESCLKAIAKDHEIDNEADFIAMKDPDAGVPTTLFVSDIKNLLDTGKCSNPDVIEVNHEANVNKDIQPNVVSTTNKRFYSYQIFYGILADNPLSFSFYLTKRSGGIRDVIISVTFSSPKPKRYFGQSIIFPKSGINTTAAIPAPNPLTCEDDKYRLTVATRHRISPDVFQQYLTNFWQLNIVQPQRYLWEEFKSSLDNGNCSTQTLQIIGDKADFTSNAIIDIGFISKAPEFRQTEPFPTLYSIELFQGIGLLCNPELLHFYKGRYNDGKVAMIMEVVRKDGTLQYFDLSNMQP